MLINTDFIRPAELTGYVRGALADLEVNQFTLSRWLPSNTIDDLDYRFMSGGQGLAEAATVRAYDAESPIGSRPGVTRVSGELPPISRKIRLGEYDRLRQRKNSDENIESAIFNDAVRMARAVAARVEMMRGEALYKGKIELNENGVVATVDFSRAVGHTTAPNVLWSDLDDSTPITDLLTWRDTYIAANGVPPGALLTSTRVVALLMRNDDIKGLIASPGSTATIVSTSSINTLLESFSLPPIYVYDAQVSVNGSGTRIIPDDRLIMLPAPGQSDLGATLWGTTAESLEPDYGVEGDEPGIVAGSYSTKDPVAVWTKAAGIALPVLATANLSFAVDVA